MYFVGIDVSKFKHDCAILDELGDVTSKQDMRPERLTFRLKNRKMKIAT